MKIIVIGCGGVGGYFGGKLALAGNDVTFVARGEIYNAIMNNGIKVNSIHGDFEVQKVSVVEQVKYIENPDLILLGVKAWQVKEVSVQLKHVIHEDTMVLPLQNGVMAVNELLEELPSKNVLSGLCKILSKIKAPGIIEHFGVEPTIVLGEINNEITDRIERIKSIFDLAGINAVIPKDIKAEVWKKFIYICVSALMALSKTNYGEMREIKETREMMTGLLNEIFSVSQKAGINIASNFVDKTVAAIDTFPYDSTSSLTRDVWEGKPSEIDYQNGTVVQLGKKYGVPTPINEFIYNCIMPMEMKARKMKINN